MKKNIIILCLILIIIPFSALAFSFDNFFEDFEEWISTEDSNSSQIINEINVSANTGGNTVINGEIKEGETKTKVEVKNIINGQEIGPIDIESEANEIKVESKIEVNEGVAKVQREVEIDSQKSAENYEVGLENETNETDETDKADETNENKGIIKESLDTLDEWWSNFLGNLLASLGNIFNIFR